MRTIDIHQAIAVCRIAADEMQAAAALQDGPLTASERRHLLAIAEAVRALLEPPTGPERAVTHPATEHMETANG